MTTLRIIQQPYSFIAQRFWNWLFLIEHDCRKSFDLNLAENVESIWKDSVESLISKTSVNDYGRNSKTVLLKHHHNVLYDIENDRELFENLLKWYPQWLNTVHEANCDHMRYWCVIYLKIEQRHKLINYLYLSHIYLMLYPSMKTSCETLHYHIYTLSYLISNWILRNKKFDF